MLDCGDLVSYHSLTMGRPRTKSNEELLAAAREVFLAHGVFGSTREIARRAGISEAALFKRFSTKAQLFMAAMAPPEPGIDAIVNRARRTKAPLRALQILSEGILDYFRVAIPLILPLVGPTTFTAADAPKNFDTNAASALVRAVALYLRDETARKRLDAKDPLGAAGILVAALHSIVLFEIMGFHDGAMPQAGVNALVEALWRGLDNKDARKRNPA